MPRVSGQIWGPKFIAPLLSLPQPSSAVSRPCQVQIKAARRLLDIVFFLPSPIVLLSLSILRSRSLALSRTNSVPRAINPRPAEREREREGEIWPRLSQRESLCRKMERGCKERGGRKVVPSKVVKTSISTLSDGGGGCKKIEMVSHFL